MNDIKNRIFCGFFYFLHFNFIFKASLLFYGSKICTKTSTIHKFSIRVHPMFSLRAYNFFFLKKCWKNMALKTYLHARESQSWPWHSPRHWWASPPPCCHLPAYPPTWVQETVICNKLAMTLSSALMSISSAMLPPPCLPSHLGTGNSYL